MKKLVSIMTMLSLLVCTTSFTAFADNNLIKAQKNRAKELKKEKWLCENNKTLEECLIEIAQKEQQGFRVLIGSAYGVDDLNDANDDARDDAFKKIGELGNSVVDGRTVTNRQKRNGKTSRNTDAAVDRRFSRQLEGLMDEPFLVIYRNNGGKYDVRQYYVINPNLINKAMEEAKKEAQDEMENAVDYGKKASEFIHGN
ncbi:MAG: hypothetical protein K2G67_01415 [Muribaculaceae bacterium]|nr:hypothetical protein [Muribaculaceae bacterium]